MKQLLLLMITLSLNTPAMAQDIVLDVLSVDRTSKIVLLAKSNSLVKVKNDTKRFWTVFLEPNEKFSDLSIRLLEVNCHDQKARVLSSSYYQNGKSLGSNDVPGDWGYITPFTLLETSAKYACQKHNPKEYPQIKGKTIEEISANVKIILEADKNKGLIVEI